MTAENSAPLEEASPADELGQSYGALLEQSREGPANFEEGSDAETRRHGDTENEPIPASPGPPVPASATSASASPPSPARIVEALLFIGGPPLTAARACEVIRGLTPAQFTAAIDTLNADYHRQGRPYVIQMQDQGGYVLTLHPRYRGVLEKLYGTAREARLSNAAVDVLALVAYRQPATKQEIDGIRGYESGGILRQLVRHGLIAVVQRGEANRREVAYGTTPRFLELFGLRNLEDLPRTQDLQAL